MIRRLPLRLLCHKAASSSTLHRVAAGISSSAPAVAAPIDHIVLFKLRPEAASSGTADAMVSSLRALSALVPVISYIHAGPVLRLRSPAAEAFGPTHLLHSRYATKHDLAAYAAHPAHVAVGQDHGLQDPNAVDKLAVDWVNASQAPYSPISPGTAVRLTLAKVKEGVEVARLVRTVAASAGEAKGGKVSFGENFSPARAKGYQFGMVAVFDSVEELDAVEGDVKVEEAKAAVRPLLDDVLVLDFVVGPAA